MLLTLPVPAVGEESAARGAADPLVEVRATYTHEFGLARPEGVAFDPRDGALLLAGPAAEGARVLRLDPAAEERLAPLSLLQADPSTVAFDPVGRRLMGIAGTDLVTLRGGPTRHDPQVRRASLAGAGLRDPVGASFDTRGDLLVLDAAGPAIVRIEGGDPHRGFAPILLSPLEGRDLHGLAVNPDDGLLYTASPDEGLLYAIDLDGEIERRYDLSSLELQSPRGMVFAPSADPTDDPSTTRLFIADAGSAELLGGVIEASLEAATPAPVPTVRATRVQTVDTSKFSPASPDPSGVTHVPGPDRLLVVDSEVDEVTGAGYHGVNMWQLTRAGNVTATGTTLAYTNEPTGVGYAPSIDTLFISSDRGSSDNGVHIVRRGPDGAFGTPDDVESFFDATVHGSNDTEDPEYDPVTGHLFFLWGAGTEVFRVNPVNGVFGDGDDIVTSFDVGRYGAGDVEGLALDPVQDTLLVGERSQDTIFQLTKSGDLLRIIDTEGVSGLSRISGLGMAPASDGSGRRNLWIADRAVDNGTNPNENDGKLFEVSIPLLQAQGPSVSVTRTDDPAPDGCFTTDCSLREAVILASATPGVDEIVLGAGTHRLSIPPAGSPGGEEDGDLDVSGSLVRIRGAGADRTIVDGGALDRVFDVTGDTVVTDLTVRNGTAVSGPDGGGGFLVGADASLTLRRVIVGGNSSTEDGGGILASSPSATLTVSKSALIDNASSDPTGGDGGALEVTDGATALLTNVTISGNVATESGGGISVSGGTLDLLNVTVSDNHATGSASDGGGIAHSGGVVRLRNTIVAGNTDDSPASHDPDCSGTLISQGGNLVEAASSPACVYAPLSSDITGRRPGLRGLGDNGGPTPTHALRPNSPAVESGLRAGAARTDQRGVRSRNDVGAYELARCRGVIVNLVGGGKRDVLVGTGGPDGVLAYGGNDRILTKGGRDGVCAGRGKDTIRAGAGGDSIRAGRGNDVLFGQRGNDELFGGPGGRDRCRQGPGRGPERGCEI